MLRKLWHTRIFVTQWKAVEDSDRLRLHGLSEHNRRIMDTFIRYVVIPLTWSEKPL